MTVKIFRGKKWHRDHRITVEWTKQAYAVMATVGSYSVHFGVVRAPLSLSRQPLSFLTSPFSHAFDTLCPHPLHRSLFSS
jgi:hypothetical protein